MPLTTAPPEAVSTPCVLCGSIARRTVTDSGRRLFFRCAASACGEYEITLRALHRLTDTALRDACRELVRRTAAEPGRIVEIVVGGDHRPLAIAVPRRRALARLP